MEPDPRYQPRDFIVDLNKTFRSHPLVPDYLTQVDPERLAKALFRLPEKLNTIDIEELADVVQEGPSSRLHILCEAVNAKLKEGTLQAHTVSDLLEKFRTMESALATHQQFPIEDPPTVSALLIDHFVLGKIVESDRAILTDFSSGKIIARLQEYGPHITIIPNAGYGDVGVFELSHELAQEAVRSTFGFRRKLEINFTGLTNVLFEFTMTLQALQRGLEHNQEQLVLK